MEAWFGNESKISGVSGEENKKFHDQERCGDEFPVFNIVILPKTHETLYSRRLYNDFSDPCFLPPEEYTTKRLVIIHRYTTPQSC